MVAYGIIHLMRYAILADVHSNLEALTAVLADIERCGGVDEFLVLGDSIGYGPDPHACISSIRELPGLVIAGNHDLAAVKPGYTGFNFNPDAATAVNWTAGKLEKDDIDFLRVLPLTLAVVDFTIAHGSPRQPESEYVMSIPAAQQNFDLLKTPHALVGHTHLPAVFKQEEGGHMLNIPFKPDSDLTMDQGRFIINPGSVGQPRDGDPRASYAIYDSEAVVIRLRRVEYDIGAIQRKMVTRNLPLRLVSRLEKGL